MSRVKIPLAFYTAVRGYSWHCTNAIFSDAELAAIENRVLACSASAPIACVFTYGDRVFFARYLKAENYDSNMRAADYYVVGAVRKYEARKVDIKKVFENEFFANPISRESALAGKFPSYLDYDYDDGAKDGKRPSGDRSRQLGAEALSSVGNWIGNEAGDVIVTIANDIANPLMDVKIEDDRHASEGTIERKVRNESESFDELGQGFRDQLARLKKNEEEGNCGDCQKDSETFFTKILNRLRSIFGLRSPSKNADGIGSNEIHDYLRCTQEIVVQRKRTSNSGDACAQHVKAQTGLINADSLSHVKGLPDEQ